MPKINLLYVITKLELGGAQKQLLGLITCLPRDRYNVFLFTARHGLLVKDADSIDGLTVRKSCFLERSINPLKDILALVEIYAFIKKNRIRIVHTHSSKAGILGRIAAWLANTEVVIHTVHGWSFNDWQPAMLRKFYAGLERLIAVFTDRIIVVSDYDKRKGLSEKIGSEDKYRLIRYGINYAEFEREWPDVRKELGVGSGELLVGMVACFKQQKAPQDFIKLAHLVSKALPCVKFVLVGDGVLRGRIEAGIEKFQLKNKIILTGWRRDIPRIIQAIDVFVLTSLWEGLPVSVLEALLAGKPVVATDTGGVAEVVLNGQTGFLCRPHRVDEMAEKIVLLLRDEKLRRRIYMNARSCLGNNFSQEDIARNTVKLYFDCLSSKKADANSYPIFSHKSN